MFSALVLLVNFELFPAVLKLMLVKCISAIFLNTIKYNSSAKVTYKSCTWGGLALGSGKGGR